MDWADEIRALTPLIAQGSLILIVLAVGLGSEWKDVVHVLKRPALLLRGLVAVNLIVPAVALLLCTVLPIATMTKVGILIMSVSPLAPFAPGKMLKTGDRSYVVGLYAALMLAAVFIVPATIALLGEIHSVDVGVPPSAVAAFVVKWVFLPLLAGVAVGSLWPDFGRRAAPIATLIAFLVLLPILILIIAKSGATMLSLLGDGSLLIIVLIVVAALAAGHMLGGPEPGQRSALAQAASTRHPGIAGLIAHRNFDDPRIMAAVLLFLLTSIVVAAFYARWASGRAGPAAPVGAVA